MKPQLPEGWQETLAKVPDRAGWDAVVVALGVEANRLYWLRKKFPEFDEAVLPKLARRNAKLRKETSPPNHLRSGPT